MSDQPQRPGAEVPPRTSSAADPTRPVQAARTDVEATQGYQPADLDAGEFLLSQEDAPTAQVQPPHHKTVDAIRSEHTTAPQDSPQPPPAARPQPHPQGKGTTLGDFRLLSKLGGGGMGTVYKAHQLSLDRDVAIKVLARHLAANPTFVQRFLREARVMARLDHPNILRCFEVKQEHGLHYYAMDYIDGGSVESWVRKLGRFSVGDALHVLLACARALEHAHEQGLIHRDIKPENVLLTRKGVVKVADLGLVKALGEDLSLTESGVGAGTPTYMAPEQMRNAKYADARSDIYALGSMLYRLLTGELPFKGETAPELLEAKDRDHVRPARQANPDVPPRLDLILERMMARRPEQRYPNCTELINDLEGLGLANPVLSFIEPGSARPSRPTTPPKPRAQPAPTPQARREVTEGTDRWYLLLPDEAGKLTTHKLATTTVAALIHKGKVDAKTAASKDAPDDYRPLGSYAQFQSALRERESQARNERKTETFKSVYAQLEREERQRQRRRWLWNIYLRVGGWVKLLIWLAILACAGIVLYPLTLKGIAWMKSKGGDFKNLERPPLEKPLEQKPGR